MKHVIDTCVAAALLILLSPLLAVLALLVLIFLGRPIFFKQCRPGFHGEPFTLLKFRSMTGAVDKMGSRLPDERRLTRLGRALRATSLDELPEMWNVLKGDMSLVGPRPLLMEYLSLYTETQARRHEVRPGITGWAQVNGRNALSWEDKFKLDVWYVENQSFWLDVKILLLTVLKVLKREGIRGAGEATMSKFTGMPVEHGDVK